MAEAEDITEPGWTLPTHAVWNHVNIEKPAAGINTFLIKCKHCNWGRAKAVTVNTSKLKAHFFPPPGSQIKKCSAPPNALLDQLTQEADSKTRKRRRDDQHKLNVSNLPPSDQQSLSTASSKPSATGGTMKDIRNAMAPCTTQEVHRAVSDFFYGDIIPFNVASSPRFVAMVRAIKSAPAGYKAPTPWQLRYPLLEQRNAELHSKVDLELEYITNTGVTFCSDGWEDVESSHMINFLYCSPHGTVSMGTGDYTDVKSHTAEFIAQEMASKIRELGPEKVVAVTTDTCSTMKKAWAILEEGLLTSLAEAVGHTC